MSQPVTIPEYGTYLWFFRAISRLMGYGADESMLDYDQAENVKELMARGLMNYYYPPPIDGVAHEWSFLTPVGGITTQAGSPSYELPEGFERFVGHITYKDLSDNNYPPIQLISEPRIRAMIGGSDYTSYPRFAAIRIIAGDGTIEQRKQVVFYPTPDSDYELEFSYHLVPWTLTSARPYPLGGKPHAEGQLAAMLAEVEMFMVGEEGVWSKKFLERLAGNIGTDRRRTPILLGYNRGSRHPVVYGRGSARDLISYDTNVTYMSGDYSEG